MARPPHALIEIDVAANSPADAGRLASALNGLGARERSLHVCWDPETGMGTLGGATEAQLDHAVSVLAAARIALALGAPQVAYRETLGQRAQIDHTHKKQSGGSGEFARVRIIFEPSKPGEGYRFVSEIVGGAVPKDYVPGVERGLESARQNGLTAGFPVIDFRATLVDGAFHDTDSSEVAFEVAARAAFGALRDLAAPKLLEPIMTVEVVAPDACIGDAIGDLNTRRGQIQRIEALGFSQAIYAKVPLARLMGFATDLDTMTNGEGSFRIEFDSYEVAPRDPWPPPDDNFPSAMAMRA